MYAQNQGELDARTEDEELDVANDCIGTKEGKEMRR